MPYIRDKPGTGKSCWVDTRKHECKLQAHSQSQNCRSFQAALLRQQGAQKGLCRISGTSLAHKPCNELAQKARLQASRHRTEQQASSCLQQPYLGVAVARIRLRRISRTPPAQDVTVKWAPPCFLRLRGRKKPARHECKPPSTALSHRPTATHEKPARHECKPPSSALSHRPTATLGNPPHPPQG